MERLWKTACFLMALSVVAAFPHATRAEEIGVILPGRNQKFFQALEKGMTQAGRDLDVKILNRSPDDGATLTTPGNLQLQLIHYMIERKVSAIILAPEPLKDVSSPVSVPVPLVLIDRDGPQFKALSTISTDNFAAGRKAALAMAPMVPARARVMVLRLAANIPSTTQREDGFLSVAKEKGWIVLSESHVGFHPREVEARFSEMLAHTAGRPDMVFAPNESVTMGALFVLEKLPPASRPRFAGFDWRPEFRTAMEAGILDAMVLQDAEAMGYRSLEMVVAACRGKDIPNRVSIDVAIATRANMNAPDIRALMRNYEER